MATLKQCTRGRLRTALAFIRDWRDGYDLIYYIGLREAVRAHWTLSQTDWKRYCAEVQHVTTTVHCWADLAEDAEARYGPASDEYAEAYRNNATCLLPGNHDGPHEWTPDDDIVVTFKSSEEVQP